MKRTKLFSGLTALALSIGLVLVGCDNGTTTAKADLTIDGTGGLMVHTGGKLKTSAATLTAGANSGATVEISAAVPHVDLSFNSNAPSITLANGGAITTKGDGKVILEALATNTGITGGGTWTYTASDKVKRRPSSR
jgi:hypothetical protein